MIIIFTSFRYITFFYQPILCPYMPENVTIDIKPATHCLFCKVNANTSKHLKGQLWPRVRDVFAYSCPAPPPLVSCDPAFVTFLLIPALPHLPWSVVTPRSWRFCLFLPRPPSPVQSCYDWIKHNIWQKNNLKDTKRDRRGVTTDLGGGAGQE